jgi:hypothetical protein
LRDAAEQAIRDALRARRDHCANRRSEPSHGIRPPDPALGVSPARS